MYDKTQTIIWEATRIVAEKSVWEEAQNIFSDDDEKVIWEATKIVTWKSTRDSTKNATWNVICNELQNVR